MSEGSVRRKAVRCGDRYVVVMVVVIVIIIISPINGFRVTLSICPAIN